MTDSGREVLPDLSMKSAIAPDIEQALRTQPRFWA